MHCQIFVNLLAVFVNKINITIRNPTVLKGFFQKVLQLLFPLGCDCLLYLRLMYQDRIIRFNWQRVEITLKPKVKVYVPERIWAPSSVVISHPILISLLFFAFMFDYYQRFVYFLTNHKFRKGAVKFKISQVCEVWRPFRLERIFQPIRALKSIAGQVVYNFAYN